MLNNYMERKTEEISLASVKLELPLLGTHTWNIHELKTKGHKSLRLHCPLLSDKGVRSTENISAYLLDNILSCDILNDGSCGGTWGRGARRTRGWLAHRAGCGREACHREPCLPRSRSLHSGCRSLSFDWNRGHCCLVQSAKPRVWLGTDPADKLATTWEALCYEHHWSNMLKLPAPWMDTVKFFHLCRTSKFQNAFTFNITLYSYTLGTSTVPLSQ